MWARPSLTLRREQDDARRRHGRVTLGILPDVWAQWVGLLIGFIGLVPLVVAALRWLLQRAPSRRLFGLSASRPLDIVLTTNGSQEEDYDGGVALAHFTVVGDVRGVASVSQTFSRLYPRKSVRVSMSESYQGNPAGDIVLIGGPRLNRWSSHFLSAFNNEYPVRVELDAEKRGLRVGDLVIDQFDQQLVLGVPREDLGLVIIAPWEQGKTAVMCGGMTTYGTEGAARFVAMDLLADRALLRRINQLRGSNEAVVIGVHMLIEARFVQRTRVARVGGAGDDLGGVEERVAAAPTSR